MAGVGLTCPECGRTARNERSLHRSRRRWRWAAVALLLGLVGPQVADQHNRRFEGWTRFVPSTLIALTALPPECRFDSLPPWRLALTQGANTRAMGSWQNSIRDWKRLDLTDDDVRAMFDARWIWTAGDDRLIELTGADRLTRPSLFETQSRTLTIRLVDEGLTYTPSTWTDDPTVGNTVTLKLPGRPVGEYADRFDVVVRNPDGWVIGRWRITMPTRIVATLDEAVPPADSPGIRSKILSDLTVSHGDWHDYTLYHVALSPPHMPDFPRPDPFGVIPLELDVLVDGELVPPPEPGPRTPWGRFKLPQTVTRDRVTLRIRSNQAAAYADHRAKLFWSGTLDVPLADIEQR